MPQIRENSGNLDWPKNRMYSVCYILLHIKTRYLLDDWLRWFFSVASVTIVHVAVLHDQNKAVNFKRDCVH